MGPEIHEYIDDAWMIIGIIWVVAAFAARPSARVQSARSRLFQACVISLAFLLLFTNRLRFGPLAWRFVPASSTALYTGFGFTIAGLLFAVWARFFLGRNWSATVTVKQDHELVRTGPYAVVRHPIYAGLTLALLGTTIAVGELRGLVAVAIAVIGWRLKFRTEETFMTEQFGTEYVDYKRRVKALIPFVW